MCGKKIRRGVRQIPPNSPPTPPSPPPLGNSLTELPSEMLLEIMKKVGSGSFISFINAKASCKALKAVGEENIVLEHLSFDQVPLLIEYENPNVEHVVNAALAAGNLSALFRLGIAHCLCAGGDFEYGFQLISNAADKNHYEAVYVFSLIMVAQSDDNDPNIESMALKSWNKIFNEEKIQEIKQKFQFWFPQLIDRPMGGPVFRVKSYKSCGSHGQSEQSGQLCMQCRLDIELQWFVETLGGTYIVP